MLEKFKNKIIRQMVNITRCNRKDHALIMPKTFSLLDFNFFLLLHFFFPFPLLHTVLETPLSLSNLLRLCNGVPWSRLETNAGATTASHKPFQEAWDYFLSSFDLSRVMGRNIKHCFDDKKLSCFSETGNHLWRLLPYAITWCRWKERSGRCFNDKEKTLQAIIIDIKALMYC